MIYVDLYLHIAFIARDWNHLPEATYGQSCQALSIVFKNTLMQHWSNQERMYDWRAEITEIMGRFLKIRHRPTV